MTNEELADELISRLNKLIEMPGVRDDLQRLMFARVPCGKETSAHPSIQVHANEKFADWVTQDPVFGALAKKIDEVAHAGDTVGFLGMLNGLVGTIPDGDKKGWGLIAAVVDDENHDRLLRFERVHSKKDE